MVRTTVAPSPPTKEGQGKRAGESPYAPGSSFFFKVKFDEPYMMYRDWREVTKMLLTAAAKGGVEDAKLPKSKMGRKETKKYVQWVKGEIKRDVKQFEGFGKGRGIIATRERFFKWLEESGKGGEVGDERIGVELRMEGAGGSSAEGHGASVGEKEKKEFGKTIIVPIAIPGVGASCSFIYVVLFFE